MEGVVVMKKKFKIMYPEDHHIPEKRGKPYHPPAKSMVVMNGGGRFFLYEGGLAYPIEYPSLVELSSVLPKYDVVWK
jgi:hypothetical protein